MIGKNNYIHLTESQPYQRAFEVLASTPISLHCWQGDNVGGFEKPGAELTGGGIRATGNYPGKARSIAATSTRRRHSSPASFPRREPEARLLRESAHRHPRNRGGEMK